MASGVAMEELTKEKFIDLEAQDSDEEYFTDVEGNSGFEDQVDVEEPTSGPTDPNLELSSIPGRPTHSPTLNSPCTTRLDALVGHIENTYIYRDFTTPTDVTEDTSNRVWLQGQDWPLWRVKCTPRQEYFLVYELMMRQIRHESLSRELRAVFYNPRDIGYLYLEASFTRTGGISSLREVLREYSDLKLSSLAIVSETELSRCLTIPSSDAEPVFAPGQWVQIKLGLYKGDVGLVADDYRDEASIRGVRVLVVPRLHFTDEDGPSAPSLSSKRKLPSRPPPQLFNPAKCVQDELIRHKRNHVFSYKSWRFEYGLQVKAFNSISLCPAREIPPSICRLFMDAKSLAGAGHLIEMSSMPLPSFWKFEPGEKVLIHSDEGQRFGTVISFIPKTPRSDFSCEVDIEGERWPILIRNLEKEILLGQYIEVVAGVHLGKKGFVVGKCDTLLGICIGQDTNGLDFRVHANSVKLAVPDYSHTQVPWLNVEVTLVSGSHIGSTGVIKDVAVNSTRSLSITVSLTNKQECIVGYHTVRERSLTEFSTRRLLMDYQPLQRHQQQFNVEVPWKDVQVTIQSGRFMNNSAIVKNVRRDFRGGLRLSLWVPRYRCSIDIKGLQQ
ncbi:hypothetical protein F5880DRAFT_1512586, partial [Lentinula raphanica]